MPVKEPTAVPIITGDSLGEIRDFGRKGIPVIYLDAQLPSISRYSRYISQRLKYTGFLKPENNLIEVLVDFGGKLKSKMVIMPSGDWDALVLAKYKKELEPFYYLPVPDYEIVHQLVNKKHFYKMLAGTDIAHPKTYFPENNAELAAMGREIAYPYIIKPSDSLAFQEVFRTKCFVINSAEDLEGAVERLRDKELEVVIQEIIPGKEVVYEFYTYFNKNSEPLAVCGWDKLRHYPPEFGSGSFCRTIHRPAAIEPAIKLLKEIGYYGMAAPELKKDSRDGQYKLLEINARSPLQNQLATAGGVNISYIAYLDTIGRAVGEVPPVPDGIFWIDDLADQLSRLILLGRREISLREIVQPLTVKKEHTVAAWDDPLPLIFLIYRSAIGALRRLAAKIFGPRSRCLDKSGLP